MKFICSEINEKKQCLSTKISASLPITIEKELVNDEKSPSLSLYILQCQSEKNNRFILNYVFFYEQDPYSPAPFTINITQQSLQLTMLYYPAENTNRYFVITYDDETGYNFSAQPISWYILSSYYIQQCGITMQEYITNLLNSIKFNS